MIPALLLFLAAPPNSPQPPREVAVLAVLGQRSGRGPGALGPFLQAAAAELEIRTTLDLRSPEQVGLGVEQLEACPANERYACWVKAVPEGPAWVGLVFARTATPGRLEVVTVWLELAGARRLLAAHPGATPEQIEAREQALYAAAIETRPAPLSGVETEELRGYFGHIFDEALAPAFDAAGQSAPNGTLVVEAPGGPQPVSVDGFVLGHTSQGVLTLRGIVAGAHQVSLPDRPAQAVQVPRGVAVEVTFLDAPRPPHFARPLGRISALVLGGAGVVLLAVGAAQASPGEAGCLVPATASNSGCPASIAVGLGADRTTTAADPSSWAAGPGYLPLGLGLLSAGGGVAAGTFLGEEPEPPWWSLALGAVGFALGFSLVTLAAGD